MMRTVLLGGCLLAAGLMLQSCDTKMYEDCPPDRIVGDWGVVNHTHTFGEYDSLYYVVNPIGNIADSVYYNGNYTDSYYHSDPVRVMLRYTTEDSIFFNLDRLYTTETNPMRIVMVVEKDTLRLRRDEDNGNLYKMGPDSVFKNILKSGKELRIFATNGPSSSETEGSQNYEFTIYSKGFDKALQMADSLNKLHKAPTKPAAEKNSHSSSEQGKAVRARTHFSL